MSTIVKYSSGSTYTIVPNKVDIEKVQDLDGQYHIPYTSIVGMLRLGLGVQRITVSGDSLDMSACLWHDVVAISFDSGTSYQTVYFSGVPYTSDCWSGIYPYALSLLASPLKEQTAVRYPTTGYKWGNQSITGISQAGNVNAYPIIHYLAPLFYAPLSNTLIDFAGQSVTFTRTASKVHGGVTYGVNVPIFDAGLYLGSDTAQDVATWTPVAFLPYKIYCVGDSLTEAGVWETRLITLLGASWNTINLGVGGRYTSEMLERFGDVTGPGDAEYVTIYGGINDIVLGGKSAADVEGNLQAMYDAAFAAGIKVVAVTITPQKGQVTWTSGLQAIIDAVNVWILNTAIHVDYRINAYAVLEDPATPDTLLPAYDDGGHLHLSTAGYNALGDAIFAGTTWFAPNSKSVAMQIKSRYPSPWSIGGGGVNLLTPNQSNAETDTTGMAVDGGALTRNTSSPIIGSGDFKLVANTGSWVELETRGTRTAVTVGRWYSAQALIKTSGCAGGRTVLIGINWYNAAGAVISQSNSFTIPAPTAITGIMVTGQAPSLTATATIYVSFPTAISGEILEVDSLMIEVLPTVAAVWQSASNQLYMDFGTNLLKWTDTYTTVSVTFPTAAYFAGTAIDLVVISGVNHVVILAAHPVGGAWTFATSVIDFSWPQLILGNLEGSIMNLIEYPYALASAEYEALDYSSLALKYNALYIGNRYAGEVVKGDNSRLLNAAGADISALLGGTDIPIGSAAVTIAQSQGLSARWYVEVQRTDV